MTKISPISVPTGPQPILDPTLAASAKGGPVDAVVFYEAPQTAAVTNAAAQFAAIDAMPLGAARKTAAYTAVHEIGTSALEAHRSQFEGLVATGKATSVDELWSLGAVRLRGASLATIRSLAATPGVQFVTQDQKIAVPTIADATSDAVDGTVELSDHFDTKTGAAEAHAADEDPNAVYEDWGVKRMHAPAAWAQGITGAGIVIGSLDTGVFVDHENLTRNYRGHNADGTTTNDYNWKDVVKETPEDGKLPDGSAFPDSDKAANGTSVRPIDLNGHGTHTSGTAVGWSPRHITGVAPDAKLIVARGLGEKGGSMFDLVGAMEWFMAPTKVDGTKPRPDMAPDIVTNSWGGAPVSSPFLWMALRNWRRSGIIPVFASGNAQPTVPHQVAVPGMYQETITVGANDLDDSRAWFSMYGPSDFSSDHKPEVTAPGHWTYSSLPDGTTRDVFPEGGKIYPASGTSMATPHVSGAIALYLQAHPGATFNDVMAALKATSTHATNADDEVGYGEVEVDKLIGTIAADAKRTDPKRVAELDAQVAKAAVWMEGVRTPGRPTKPPAPATVAKYAAYAG